MLISNGDCEMFVWKSLLFLCLEDLYLASQLSCDAMVKKHLLIDCLWFFSGVEELRNLEDWTGVLCNGGLGHPNKVSFPIALHLVKVGLSIGQKNEQTNKQSSKIYWSIDLMVYGSTDLLIHRSIDPSIYLHLSTQIHRSTDPPIYSDPSIYWSIDLLIHWSTDLLIHLCIDLPIPWSTYPSIYWSTDLLIHWSTDLPIYWSIDLPIYWSIDLLIHRSTDPLILWSTDPSFHRSIDVLVHRQLITVTIH